MFISNKFEADMRETDTHMSINTKCKVLLWAHTDWNHLLKNDNFQWWSNRIRPSINSFGRRPTSKVTSWLQTSRPQQASGCSFRRGLQETVYRDPIADQCLFSERQPLAETAGGRPTACPPIHISLFLYLQQITHSGGKAAGIDWLCGYTILSDIS